jgi:hypothetical protein
MRISPMSSSISSGGGGGGGAMVRVGKRKHRQRPRASFYLLRSVHFYLLGSVGPGSVGYGPDWTRPSGLRPIWKEKTMTISKKKKMTDESYKFHMFFCKYNLLSVKKKGLGRRHFFNRVVTMESQTSLKCAWLAT